MLQHNSGFCNNCTPNRCLHISVHSFPNKCITKHPFYTTAIWKVWNSMKNYIILFCLEKIMWCSALWSRRCRFHCYVAAPYFLKFSSRCTHSPTGAYLSWPAVSLRKSKNNDIYCHKSRDRYRPWYKVHLLYLLALAWSKVDFLYTHSPHFYCIYWYFSSNLLKHETMSGCHPPSTQILLCYKTVNFV